MAQRLPKAGIDKDNYVPSPEPSRTTEESRESATRETTDGINHKATPLERVSRPLPREGAVGAMKGKRKKSEQRGTERKSGTEKKQANAKDW